MIRRPRDIRSTRRQLFPASSIRRRQTLLFLTAAAVTLTFLYVNVYLVWDLVVEEHQQWPQQQHTNTTTRRAIPNVVIFTHYIDLLHANLSTLAMDDAPERAELQVLQDNVHRIIQLHPMATIRFLTDEDCRQAIRRLSNATLATTLLDYFNRETTGMYKADLCRGAALWETGGLYFDVDLGVRVNVLAMLSATTDFATVKVHPQSHHPGSFFQAFMATSPHHAVIARYLELFGDHAEGRLPDMEGKPLGVVLLKRAYDHVLAQQPTLGSTSELWQEVLYHWINASWLEHVPPPTWGTRRACKFIVVAGTTVPLRVPFYSRIAGSRMCPVTKE